MGLTIRADRLNSPVNNFPLTLVRYVAVPSERELSRPPISNDPIFCRVSILDARDAVSIPTRRLFGRHGSRYFVDDRRVNFTSLARGVSYDG